jgi:hypothetical protein
MITTRLSTYDWHEIYHSLCWPVRYALGQFDLDIPNLEYPDVEHFEPVNGLVARLLRSGYVYIYIEDGAKKQADEDGEIL